jgi:hypothetical protein
MKQTTSKTAAAREFYSRFGSVSRLVNWDALREHFAAICRQQLLANSNAAQKRDVSKMDDDMVIWLATNQLASFSGGRTDPAYDRLTRKAQRARDARNKKRRDARRRRAASAA